MTSQRVLAWSLRRRQLPTELRSNADGVAMAATFTDFDDTIGLINRKAFQRRGVLRHFGLISGWLEAGEKAAVLSVADEVMGSPILDIGVGGGRTAPLMQEISSDYCGIDYAPAALAVARKRFPTFDFREMDARVLNFRIGAFGLVTFSYNGIDAVGLEGRLAILREVHRVLRPGGYFVFSSLNRNGGEWQPHWPNWNAFQGAGQSPGRLLNTTAKLLRSGINHLRHLRWCRDDGEAGIGNLAAHDFSLVPGIMGPRNTV